MTTTTTNTTTNLYVIEYIFEGARESECIGAYLNHDEAYELAKEQAKKAARFHMHGFVNIITCRETADGAIRAIIDADNNIRYYGEKDDIEDFIEYFAHEGVSVRTVAYRVGSVEPIAF